MAFSTPIIFHWINNCDRLKTVDSNFLLTRWFDFCFKNIHFKVVFTKYDKKLFVWLFFSQCQQQPSLFGALAVLICWLMVDSPSQGQSSVWSMKNTQYKQDALSEGAGGVKPWYLLNRPKNILYLTKIGLKTFKNTWPYRKVHDKTNRSTF